MRDDPEFFKIYQAHLDLCYEIERRDVVFRMGLDSSQRYEKSPWIMSGREGLEIEEQEIWQQLGGSTISEEEALETMTALMEQYYGLPYPLK